MWLFLLERKRTDIPSTYIIVVTIPRARDVSTGADVGPVTLVANVAGKKAKVSTVTDVLPVARESIGSTAGTVEKLPYPIKMSRIAVTIEVIGKQ